MTDLLEMDVLVHRWAFGHRMKTEQKGLWSALESLIAGGRPTSASTISESTIRMLRAAIPSPAADGTGGLANLMTVNEQALQELLVAVGKDAVASGIYKGMDAQHLTALETSISPAWIAVSGRQWL